jgi:glucose/arabinose dehydrogenase
MTGWSADGAPLAPPGFIVERFADGLESPRWLYVLPNNDVLVAQARTERMARFSDELNAELTRQGVFGKSPNNIILLRSTSTGVSRHRFIDGLNQPFGMVLVDGNLLVANTDALVRYPYQEGQTRIDTAPEKLLDIPAGKQSGGWNNHWTRNIVASPDRRSLYLSVGAATNIDKNGNEHPERAAIWRVDADGWRKSIFATGLRNPVGMDFDPVTGDLWATVNERDGLGEDVPPDYLTRVVEGAFYGWPYVYFGTYADPTHAKLHPDRVRTAQRSARVPDLAIGAHSVPLGLLFYRGNQFPEDYRHGAFVARRGGVSRARFVGIDVIFVSFERGQAEHFAPFLTGFIADYDQGAVYGRPAGLAMLADGSLLVADDSAGIIWRVRFSPGSE